ncbi:type IV secretion system DNA-binding domain-containing protein [Candidatus Beckwithbacteria bacterium]|nr:type IV secretion system DNA-binding domain-containing protein [Candidatus Beckwithbacteria bacterium]
MENTNSDTKLQILKIKIPHSISNSLEIFNSFFSDLHKLLKASKNFGANDKTISLEICLEQNYFQYQIVTTNKSSKIIKPLLYTKFPNLEIFQSNLPEETFSAPILKEYMLERSQYFPLKTTFNELNDPYLVLATILSKLEHFEDKITIQLTISPTSESWLKQFLREKFFMLFGLWNNLKVFLKDPFLEKTFINYYEEVKKKYDPKLFQTNLRILIQGQDRDENLALIEKALDKLDNGDINALTKTKNQNQKELQVLFKHRKLTAKPFLLNTQEIAAIYHFPDEKLKISNVDHIKSKRIEAPNDLPKAKFLHSDQISSFALTNYRDNYLDFGIKRFDRNRHLYVIGKTGMGKSKLIELLVLSDIYQNKGFCIIDPHGDLASDILKKIPQNRIQDIIYFNPADLERPIGFNPLECHSPEAKDQVVVGFIGIFKKLFAHNWTNRLEHMLRFIVLALVEAGDATIIDIVKLLTDVDFRHDIIAKIQNPVVKNFWVHEFSTWNEKFDNEAIIPIINQVGQFISNDYIRYTVGQKRSALNFYQAMQEKKIVIVNIAKGKLGEENTALLGSMLITKIQEATMARVNIPENERKEFYLYVDEFQHFATEAFNQILSEARKFNLSLTIAHQYLGQLTDSIRKTVFGNVGSFIAFRVGPEDARFLAKEFTPKVEEEDLINLDSRNIYVKVSIGGKTCEPFSAVTLKMLQAQTDLTEEIIKFSREKYGTSRSQINETLNANPQTMNLISGEGELKTIFEEPII